MKWKSILKGIMPIASTVIGTANPLAGHIFKKASQILLGKPDGTEEEVQEALKNATPDQIAAMRKADQDFKLELQKNGIKLEEIHAEDRDSARKMSMATGGDAQEILAAVFIIGYFAIFYCLASGEIKVTPENSSLITILMGIMSAAVTQIINFFFGSSKGSKDKTKALQSLTK